MRKFVFSLIFLSVATMAWGIPANNQYVQKQMADGSSVMVRLVGDEFFNYMVTSDGRVVKNVNGVMVETGMTERDMTPSYIAQKRSMSKLKSNMRHSTKGTTSGAYTKGLVILVNFSDQSFTYPKNEFYNKLNQPGYSTNGAPGSVKDYFTDNSGGTFSPNFDVFGPYTLDHTTAYYGGPDSNGENDIRPAQMILDAVRKLAADPSANVNFADYDCDNDGIIDNVFIYYAGCGQNIVGNDFNFIWPHRWYVSPNNTNAYDNSDLIFGGKKLQGYACASELSGSQNDPYLCGIGAFCHEFSHVLGLMDLYDTDHSSNHVTFGQWDIMCSGCYLDYERTPSGYSTFERFVVGWYNPPVITSAASYELDYTLRGHEGYIITSTGTFNHNLHNPSPSEYYVLENRQKESWDTYLPGHGMLVTKIVWDNSEWENNSPVNDPDNMVVDLIEAGGPTDDMGSPSDPFPGTRNVKKLTTYPEFGISNISENNQKITFDINGGIAKGPFIVSFDERNMGIADTTSLKEAEECAGVVLPNVTPNYGYQFIGWCQSITGNDTAIYPAGSTFKPKRNTILFAVYKENNRIVEDYYGECMTEHFSKLGNSQGIDISTTINSYADNKGWSGNTLESNVGMVKVGNNTVKGYITTPNLNMQGTVEVVFILSQESRSYFGVVTSDRSSSDYPLAPAQAGVVRATLHNVTPNSRIEFISDVNSFDIGGIYICGDVVTPVVETEAEHNEPVILREKVMGGHVRIEGLSEGMRVMVVDGMGRILMSRDADDDTMEFEAPETVYFIKIL